MATLPTTIIETYDKVKPKLTSKVDATRPSKTHPRLSDIRNNFASVKKEVEIIAEIVATARSKIPVFTTTEALTFWDFSHTLDGYPAVIVMEVVGDNREVIIGEVIYKSTSQIQITFSLPVTGEVYLS